MLSLLATAALIAQSAVPLTTVAEQSGWTRTGRYDEVLRLCDAFPRAYPGKVKCERFATTPEGRPMVALSASADGALDPASAKKKGRPVVLLQGGIHAGEIDGKDAGFWLLRDLLDGKVLPGTLGKLTVLFVPVFNVDGHERFGPNHRPNQRGPEEMGYRVTSQNLNLNRDYAKAEAPEMAAMLRLLDRWDPVLYLDLHVTDGAMFQPDVSISHQPLDVGAEPMRALGREARDAVFATLKAQGHQPLDFYPSFLQDDQPATGFARGIPGPRFQLTYWMLRNRYGVLVETHSWKDYATRVKATRDTSLAYLEQVAKAPARWLEVAKQADDADRAAKDAEATVAWGSGGPTETIEFPGYHYVIEPSTISGKPWIRYDETKPEVWKIPLRTTITESLKLRAPAGGYVVPAGHAAWVGEKLKLHGFTFQVVGKALAKVPVQAFRATEVKLRDRPTEGRSLTTVKGAWADAVRDVPAGSLYVPAAQRGRALLVGLLDPEAPDSFASWGFFNAAWEEKDGMEEYVAESEARKMLAADPKLKAEFDQRLAAEPAFAKDATARLNFFRQHHPSFDERFNLYPVYRTAGPLPK